jgi:hypothetical protein
MRRIVLVLLSCAVVLGGFLTGCTTLAALVGNDVTFTAPQLQSQLDRRFPRDYDKAGGLVTLTLLHPRLTIPQGSGRLQLDFDVGIGGMGMDSHSPAGHFALQSGLRFDPNTRGLHLADPALVGVDVPMLGGRMNDATRSVLNQWIGEYAREEPVYRLDDTVWGRMAGRRIGETTIGNGVVTLHLDQ